MLTVLVPRRDAERHLLRETIDARTLDGTAALGEQPSSRAVRAFAFGWLSIVLALHLARRGLSLPLIGSVLTGSMVMGTSPI